MSENFNISLDNTKLMMYNNYTKLKKGVFSMEETMKNTVEEQLDGQMMLEGYEDEQNVENSTDVESVAEDPIKDAVEEQLKKIQRQNLLLGAQTMCRVVLQKIVAAQSKPGKMSMNDYKRLTKDIESFCRTGLSRKVNADGETEPIEEESAAEETVQN